MTTNVLLCADVGRSFGLGHMQRAVALAEALEEGGAAPLIALMGEAPHTDVFSYRRFPSVICKEAPGSRDALDLIQDLSKSHDADALVMDSYHLNEEHLRGLSQLGRPLAVVDDLALTHFDCDLVIAPSAHAQAASYRGTPSTSFLLGPRFVMLRREFRQPTARARAITDAVTVLVTVGGADPYGLTPKLVAAARSVDGAKVIAVIGPFFESGDHTLNNGARDDDIEVVNAPPSLRGLLDRCDIALCSGGQTLYEMAAMGVPAIAVESADNQQESLMALARAGTVKAVGRADHPGATEKVGEALRQLITDHSLRSAMEAAGRSLIDGRGALRVADAILALRYE